MKNTVTIEFFVEDETDSAILVSRLSDKKVWLKKSAISAVKNMHWDKGFQIIEMSEESAIQEDLI